MSFSNSFHDHPSQTIPKLFFLTIIPYLYYTYVINEYIKMEAKYDLGNFNSIIRNRWNNYVYAASLWHLQF